MKFTRRIRRAISMQKVTRARQQNGEPQKQLSKEFVREWLMESNFQGKEGQRVPEMTGESVNRVSERYIELLTLPNSIHQIRPFLYPRTHKQ